MQTKRRASRRRSSFLSRRGRFVGQPLDRQLRLEPLEDRRMLAVVMVDNNLDLVNGATASEAAFSNIIGGTAAGAGNVISGNTLDGIQLAFGSFSNFVLGNFIGTDISGGADPNAPLNLGNLRNGIAISDGNDKIIGGVTIAERNVLAGNLNHGVSIKPGDLDLPTQRNQVLGNYIGVLIDGVTGHGNIRDGVYIEEASDNIIGGTAVGAGNLISGNHASGIVLNGASTTDNKIKANSIGVAGNKTSPLANGYFGIFIGAANNTMIDGTDAEDGSTDFIVNAGNKIAFNGTSEFSIVDTDGDAIADAWETPGMGIDFDEDGTIDLDLAAKGARPDKKDVLVEIDSMEGFAPSPTVLDWVKNGRGGLLEGFAKAPADLVQNPDGSPGINLIWELDETFTAALWTGDADGDGQTAAAGDTDDQGGFPFFEKIKANTSPFVSGGFGSKLERIFLATIEAKRLVYHYTIFANQFATAATGGGTHNGTSGIAELFGNDVIVSLGDWPEDGTPEERAGTFMHELGHNLGLKHGGRDSVNYKPNYHSFLNYTWQSPKEDYEPSWRLDYSREKRADLNEASLNETAGLGGDPFFFVPIGPIKDTIQIPLLEDLLPEDDETVSLTLSNPTNGAVLGDRATSQLTIIDDDNAGQLQFVSSSYIVDESSGARNVVVERFGGTQGAITVDFELEDGTASSTHDYEFASGTLSFADGEASQIISVQISDDELGEGDEYFNVTLSNPTGGASLGEPSTTAINIGDDETPWTVTNTNNSGPGSLRLAIQYANARPGVDAIVFRGHIFNTPQTISLTTGELDISEAVTINGPGGQLLTIDARGNSRVFHISAAGGDVTLAGLSISGELVTGQFDSGKGGAIRSDTDGNLTIERSTISGSSTTGQESQGGGIFSYGDLTLINSTVSGNSTTGDNAEGGGIYGKSDVTIISSTVSGNDKAGFGADGGGVYSRGDMTLTSSTISGNNTTGITAKGNDLQRAINLTLSV